MSSFIDEVPKDVVAIDLFVIVQLCQLVVGDCTWFNPSMFLGYRLNKKSKYNQFYFLVGEKIECYYFLEFADAVREFKPTNNNL